MLDETSRRSRHSHDRASLSGTNIERAGDYNQRVALQSIRVGLAKTKQEVAAYTGLTVPAVTNITNRLLDDGLIIEAGKLHGHRGQPAMTFGVIARIHWQALQLWLKRVPFFAKPPAPAQPLTQGTPNPPTALAR